MIKYVPSQKMLLEIKGKSASQVWEWASSKTKVYTEIVGLCQYFEKTVFFSPKKIQKIPVNGILLPAEWFDATEV